MKWIKLFIAVLFFTPLCLTAAKDHHFSDRVYLSVSFQPGVSYRIMKVSTPDLISLIGNPDNLLLSARAQKEHPRFGFSAGFRSGIKISNAFSVEAGLEYSRFAYNVPNASIVLSSFLASYPIKASNVDYTYDYLNIPVGINYLFGNKKVKGILSVGVLLDFLVHQTAKGTLSIGTSAGTETSLVNSTQFSKFNLSPYLGLGIEYPFNKQVFLRLMPVFRMQALENISSPVTEHLWSCGLNATFYFHFKAKKKKQAAKIVLPPQEY